MLNKIRNQDPRAKLDQKATETYLIKLIDLAYVNVSPNFERHTELHSRLMQLDQDCNGVVSDYGLAMVSDGNGLYRRFYNRTDDAKILLSCRERTVSFDHFICLLWNLGDYDLLYLDFGFTYIDEQSTEMRLERFEMIHYSWTPTGFMTKSVSDYPVSNLVFLRDHVGLDIPQAVYDHPLTCEGAPAESQEDLLARLKTLTEEMRLITQKITLR